MTTKFTYLKSCALAACVGIAMATQAQFAFTNSNNLLSQTTMRSGNSISVVDVNFDGLDDILRMDYATDLHLELQQKNGTFTHYSLGTISNNGVWGMAAADVDHNGWIDIVTGPNGSCYLVKLFETGGVVSAVTTTLGNSNFFVQNITFGDFDNDGWADVYVCDDNAFGKVYMNDGAGNLNFLANSNTNITIGTGSKTISVQSSCTFTVGQTVKVGFDGNNYMIGTVTAFSAGSLTFNVTSFVGTGAYGSWSVHQNLVLNHRLKPTLNYGNDPADSGNYGSVWLDFDNDGDLDFFVAHCRQATSSNTDFRRKDRLFVNDGNNNYTEMAGSFGLETTNFKQTWTASFADIDNDADLDLMVTNHGENGQILENDGTGHYTDITVAAGFTTNFDPIESQMEDFDNDGFVDILITENQWLMYHNNGNKTFTKVNNVFADLGGMLSFAMGDLNHDGAIDIFSSYGGVYNNPSSTDNDVLYLNTTQNNNNFITFNLKGVASNIGGIGGRATIYGTFGKQIREVRAGDSYGTSNSFQLHFGIGTNTSIDSVVIKWPSGIQTHLANLVANQFVTVIEGQCTVTNNIIPGNQAICAGQSIILNAQPGFSSYLWSNGATTQSITVTAGIYNVAVTDANTCTNLSPSTSIQLNPDETPAIAIVGNEEFCEGSPVILTGPAGYTTYNWSNGETTQSITVNQSSNITLTIQGVCQPYTSTPVTLVAHATNITANDATLPGYGNISLVANSTAQTINWYNSTTATTPIFTGNTYNTTVNIDTTVFYVEASNIFYGDTVFGGMLNSNGSGYSGSTTISYKMFFDVLQQSVLKSFKVYTDKPGKRKFLLYNSSNILLNSFTDSIPMDSSVVNVNWNLMPGTGYYLATDSLTNTQIPNWGTSGPRLMRRNSGTAYPYLINNAVKITNSDQGTQYYYYYYDWEVQKMLTCTTPRIPVHVYAATGITETENSQFELYPNPANEILNISLKNFANASVVIIDNSGRIMLSEKLTASINSISTEGLAKGFYTVLVNANGNKATAKLIVE